jgi:hypothetical protein
MGKYHHLPHGAGFAIQVIFLRAMPPDNILAPTILGREAQAWTLLDFVQAAASIYICLRFTCCWTV